MTTYAIVTKNNEVFIKTKPMLMTIQQFKRNIAIMYGGFKKITKVK